MGVKELSNDKPEAKQNKKIPGLPGTMTSMWCCNDVSDKQRTEIEHDGNQEIHVAARVTL